MRAGQLKFTYRSEQHSIAQENGEYTLLTGEKKKIVNVKCTIYDPRVFCSHSRLLEHLGLARKQWWWLVVVADSERAQLSSSRSLALISTAEFWDLLDKHHVWEFCFHALLLRLVFRYHRAHWRSLQQSKRGSGWVRANYTPARRTRRAGAN